MERNAVSSTRCDRPERGTHGGCSSRCTLARCYQAWSRAWQRICWRQTLEPELPSLRGLRSAATHLSKHSSVTCDTSSLNIAFCFSICALRQRAARRKTAYPSICLPQSLTRSALAIAAARRGRRLQHGHAQQPARAARRRGCVLVCTKPCLLRNLRCACTAQVSARSAAARRAAHLQEVLHLGSHACVRHRCCAGERERACAPQLLTRRAHARRRLSARTSDALGRRARAMRRRRVVRGRLGSRAAISGRFLRTVPPGGTPEEEACASAVLPPA
jgi:hypothetical protein